jgi:hypothetical protein
MISSFFIYFIFFSYFFFTNRANMLTHKTPPASKNIAGRKNPAMFFYQNLVKSHYPLG